MSGDETGTTEQTLTADDIGAMRLADSITLHRQTIRLYLRAYAVDRVYTRREQLLFRDTSGRERMRDIATDASVTTYRSDDGSSTSWLRERDEGKGPAPECFYSWYDRDVIATVVAALRSGDRLTLRWTANNSSQATRDAGLYVDHVHLRVDPAKGPARLYLLGYGMSPDNSARMVKSSG